jgi:hypothetical protein
MKLAELQHVLHAVNPAAILVAPQVLERVVQQVWNMPAVPWDAPHRKSFVVTRKVLFNHIEQEDLELNPEYELPTTTMILLVRPSHERLASEPRDSILGDYWRLLFHASIHHRLETLWHDEQLTQEEIRARIDQIGQTEFAEIRKVLVEDRFLLSSATEQALYIEFAAVYLELRYFAANMLPICFPSLADGQMVEQILSRDFNPEELFRATRLLGAPDPVPRTDNSSDESHDYYWNLVRRAERAADGGNTVRAAILRTKAARVAPANLTRSTRAEAEADMHRLAGRLETALELTRTDAAEWCKDLNSLLDKADQGNRTVEAELLFDLQNICLDTEEGIYALSLIDWLLSAGRRPIKRQLVGQRQVRVIKHLRNASQRLTMARLSDTDRQHLGRLLRAALQQSEERLRARFRPTLESALIDVGLEPGNLPEKAAFYKVIEELLDRIVAQGFLTFSDVRDTISRNQLKLPDLADPQDFARGDPLLRLDRRLGSLLDGVYRPSELYLRVLERFTAVNFGTKIGRLLTRYITLPFGGAFLLLLCFNKVVLHYTLWLFGVSNHATTLETVLTSDGMPVVVPRFQEQDILPMWVLVALTPLLGAYILALVHSNKVRQRSRRLWDRIVDGLRLVFVDWPVRLARMPWLRTLSESWPIQFFYWILLKPVLVCLLIGLLQPAWFTSLTYALTVFFVVLMIVNLPPGRALSELIGQGLLRFFELLQAGLIRGLFNLIVWAFKELVSLVESILFTVDEWLRFRSGEGQFLLVVRIILGMLWFPISYLTRFYIVVLIEPGFNPIKAPISITAAKVVYPIIYPTWFLAVGTFLAPWIGSPLAWAFSGATIWLMPDAFGFLVWELKENWSLYRANRPATIKPLPIGHHGETVLELLEPGFHSGTVPRLFYRWRRAERLATKTGNWRVARSYRRAIEEIEELLRQFVVRNLVALVQQSSAWRGQSLGVGPVDLTCSRIRIELTHSTYPDAPVRLEFEEHEGWLVATIQALGWLRQVPGGQLLPLNSAVVCLFKQAGVGLVREQIRAVLPKEVAAYDIKARELILWLDHRYGRAIAYDWRAEDGYLKPHIPDGDPAPDPRLDATRMIFARMPLSWQQWVESWQKDQDGVEHPRLFSAGVELDLLSLALGNPPPSSPSPSLQERPAAETIEMAAAPDQVGPVLTMEGAIRSAGSEVNGERS